MVLIFEIGWFIPKQQWFTANPRHSMDHKSYLCVSGARIRYP